MRRFMLVFAVSACLFQGCATDEDLADEIAATTTQVEVARVTTTDGATWRFIEAEPGELVLMGQVVEGHTSSLPTDSASLDRMSYVAIYKRLTSAPVPRALLDAQARVDAESTSETTDTSSLVNEASGPPTTGTLAGITASAFQDTYCWGGSWDFKYCWPSFVGNPFVQRKTYSMYGHAARVSHTATMQLRVKKHWYSSWNDVSAQMLPGYVYYAYSSYFGYRRWRRFEVIGNGANEVRYALVGSD